jgi:S-adenosylmethionine synthetase
VAEQICEYLCRYYLEHFGFVLHHNVDKVLLCGGRARPSFGGGEILDPIEIYIAGRAAEEYHGQRIPVDEIAEQACRDWLRANLPSSSVEQNVTIVPNIRPGSTDLVQLFGKSTLQALSNDTSCGAGFAPLSDLENAVLEVERRLNSPETKRAHPGIGVDIKVMGVRQARHIDMTISCALVDRYVNGIDDYVRQKDIIRDLALGAARRVTDMPIQTVVNAADDIEHQSVFLTVTGTSAEAGDDGEAGRGNRICGLITPYRTMTIEAAVGKNPVTHVGKLYNLLASRIAETIVASVDGVTDALCVLVSQIGRPVRDPQLAELRLASADKITSHTTNQRVTDIMHAALAQVEDLRHDLIAGRVRLY